MTIKLNSTEVFSPNNFISWDIILNKPTDIVTTLNMSNTNPHPIINMSLSGQTLTITFG